VRAGSGGSAVPRASKCNDSRGRLALRGRGGGRGAG
jgi:hypothetical protein